MIKVDEVEVVSTYVELKPENVEDVAKWHKLTAEKQFELAEFFKKNDIPAWDTWEESAKTHMKCYNLISALLQENDKCIEAKLIIPKKKND